MDPDNEEAKRYLVMLKSINPSKSEQEIAVAEDEKREAVPDIQEKAKRFIDNGNGTVTDNRNGLMWTKGDSYTATNKGMKWANAKGYVNGLSTGGYSDWRMPTINELKMLYEEKCAVADHTGLQRLHFNELFSPGGAWRYWSSDEKNGYVHIMNFVTGTDHETSHIYYDGYGVRAVRRLNQ